MEVETAETVSCGMARVFPAKELMFQIFFGDQELSPFLSWEGDTAWANATVRAMETGDQELSCLVSLGPMEQKTRELVHVYSKLPASSLPRKGSLPLKTSAVKPWGLSDQCRQIGNLHRDRSFSQPSSCLRRPFSSNA